MYFSYIQIIFFKMHILFTLCFFNFRQLGSERMKVHCPYNASHYMYHKTLHMHLLKCPDKKPHFKHCSFNNLHVMHEDDLEVKYQII